MPPRKTTSSKRGEKRTPRGRPRLEDVAAIEKKLLALAFDEFQKHGYGGASVSAIARAARREGRPRLAEGLKSYANSMTDLSFKGGLLDPSRVALVDHGAFTAAGK